MGGCRCYDDRETGEVYCTALEEWIESRDKCPQVLAELEYHETEKADAGRKGEL